MKRLDVAWVVILAGVSAALHIGKLPPALPVLRDALGVSLVQAGFLVSLVQLAGMTLGLAVGLIADGVGLKRSMVLGLLVLAAASTLGGWAQDVPVLLALRALEGLGLLLVCMPAPSLIRRLVTPERTSLMMGLWGACMPMGLALALLLGPLAIAATDWRSWWEVLAAVSLAMALWIGRAVPAIAYGPGPAHTHRGGWSQRLARTLSSRGPWLVALAFAMYSCQWLAVIGFLPSIYAQSRFPAGMVGALTALVAAANMVGNIASGRMLQRAVPPHVLLVTGFSVMALGALLAFAPLPIGDHLLPWRYLAVLLFSAVGGLIPGTLFFLAVKLAPGESDVSTTIGWMQQWSAFGQLVGPPLIAFVASAVGGWHWTWAVTGTCALAGIALAAAIGQLETRRHAIRLTLGSGPGHESAGGRP